MAGATAASGGGTAAALSADEEDNVSSGEHGSDYSEASGPENPLPGDSSVAGSDDERDREFENEAVVGTEVSALFWLAEHGIGNLSKLIWRYTRV